MTGHGQFADRQLRYRSPTTWRLYRQQLFAALAWWTGTLGQPREVAEMRAQDTSREFIHRITHAIDDLDALEAWD